MKHLRRALCWMLLAAALVVVATWPTAARIEGHLLEPLHLPDVQGGMYWPWAFARSLVAGEPVFLRPELAWPDGQDVRLIIWNYGVQLLIFPLFLWRDPIAATNLAALLIATINGLAGAWAGRAWGRLGAAAGLLVAACAPYGFIEAGVGRPEQGLWAPLALVVGGLVRLWDDPADRRARAAVGLGLAIAGWVYWFYAIFALVLLALIAGPALVLSGDRRRRAWALAVAGALAVVAVLPAVLPVIGALRDQPDALSAAVVANDNTMTMQTRAAVLLPWGLLGPLAEGLERSWRTPLLLVPACLAAAAVGRGGVRLAGLMGLAAAALAGGPVLLNSQQQAVTVARWTVLLPGAALNALPGFDRFWWPYRWQAMLLAAGAVVVPWGLSRLPRPRLLLGLLAVWSVLECGLMLRDGGDRDVLGPAAPPAVFAAIGEVAGVHPILQLPSVWLRNSRVGWIPWHGQPIDGGMGWGMMRDRAADHAAKLAQIPMLELARRAALDRDIVGPERFTEADSGGFHYVIFYNEGPTQQRGPVRRGLKAVLGQPFWEDRAMLVWAVPGLGVVPDAYREAVLP